ncbi:hypothetical protein KR032_003533 [Drosophila birchii]|nr:hypothetical protein KR032_003533 [Drosophila birchii]
MKSLTVLALLVLATWAYVEALEVSIREECIECTEHLTTGKLSPAQGHGVKTTAKPRTKTTPTCWCDDLSGEPPKKAGKCWHCNELFTTTTTTTRKPSPPQGHGRKKTAKIRSKTDKLSGLSQQQTVGAQKAGKVSIKSKCIHCNELFTTTTTTTRKPSPPQGHGNKATAKPKSKTSPAPKILDSIKDNDVLTGWSLSQPAGKTEIIA